MHALHRRAILSCASALALAAAAAPTVHAQPIHEVATGESLWQVAAANGMSPAALAAANGLSADAGVRAGQVLSIPPRGAAIAPTAAVVGTPAVAPTTASATSGTTAAAPTAAAAAGGPAATSGHVSGGEIAAIAARNGVPPSLAQAIAWQESGFDNGAVSSVGARGVMQVMPGTWSWIGGNLAGRALDPSSATDNVEAGTLYLGHLLRETGGDQAQAAAGYYQGLGSVRSRGRYDDTERYVRNVEALRSRFGG